MTGFRTNLPDDEYIRRVGIAAYLVTSVEGLLLSDLPRFSNVIPVELQDADVLAGRTMGRIANDLQRHGANSSDPDVAAYLVAGGKALEEISTQRNSVLHARPATDESGDEPLTRLYRWRPPDAFVITDQWLDDFAHLVDKLNLQVLDLRPGFDKYPA